MEPCSIAVLALLAFAVVGGMSAYQLEDRKRRAQAVAGRLGLEVQGTDELVGHFHDVGVRCYSKDQGASGSSEWWTFTRCTLREPLPAGMAVASQGFLGHIADLFGMKDIQLGNELDPALRVSGNEPDEVRELLTDPEVLICLRGVVAGDGRIELQGSQLEIKIRGRHLDQAEATVPQAVALVLALALAGRGHWDQLAKAHGLRIDAQATQIQGQIEGVELTIRMAKIGGRRCTVVAASFGPSLPQGTEIRHTGDAADGVRLGDPILDSMVAVRCLEPEALARRVCTDAVRGPLLEVVHGHRGSMLRSDRVDLVAPGRLGRGLQDAVRSVVDLVKALQEG